jgi:spermidine synthase
VGLGVTCGLLLVLSAHQVSAKVLVASRNFHGRLQVEESLAAGQPVYLMTHGRVVHGLEFAGEQRAMVPSSYFSETSGIGVVLNQPQRAPWAVGVIGLGAGVLAAWCRPSDRWTFYELDPEVVRYASGEGGYFRFLSHCPSAQVVVGDARRSLEAELAGSGSRQFDLLVLDAFSGDSIPAHLVTKEAFALYRAHLKPGGVLAFHISNLYLDLSPVVARLALETGLVAASLVDVPVDRPWAAASEWMLMSADERALGLPRLKAVPAASQAQAVWTDDFSDLVSVLNVRR